MKKRRSSYLMAASRLLLISADGFPTRSKPVKIVHFPQQSNIEATLSVLSIIKGHLQYNQCIHINVNILSQIYCNIVHTPFSMQCGSRWLKGIAKEFSVPIIEYPPGGSSKKCSHVNFLLYVFWVILLSCYNCCSDTTMVTWCHNSTIWRHNSSSMAIINRK